ncbi:hypothetical protein [Streptomyces sp. NBC_00986]|uniref:hypothetical protein n=1 Tax=Streptomyces sp. NBC_00986 TaxID=2903702 RepID=UPI00386D5A99|nr:hypothetical protein OG504_37970 [Streptomyces sp. NBC_00986]
MGIPPGVSGAAAAEGLGELLGEAVVRRAPRLLGGKRVYLYEEGLVLGSGVRVRRWADVTRWRSTVDVIVTSNEQNDRAWYTLAHRHLLRFGDGTEQGFLLDERRTELRPMVAEPFENRGIRYAAEHVRKRVAAAQAPAMLDRIEKGRQVTFGPLTADAHGVFVPGGLLVYRWAEMREPYPAVNLPDFPVPSSWWLRPRDVRLVLLGKDGDGNPHRTEVPAWEVVNWGALVTLWKRLRAG